MLEERKVGHPEKVELFEYSSGAGSPQSAIESRPSTSQAICPIVGREKDQIAFFDSELALATHFVSASDRNFTIADFHSPSSILIEGKPFGAEVLRDRFQLVAFDRW